MKMEWNGWHGNGWHGNGWHGNGGMEMVAWKWWHGNGMEMNWNSVRFLACTVANCTDAVHIAMNQKVPNVLDNDNQVPVS